MGIYVQGYGTFPASAQNDIAERLLEAARGWATDRGLQDLYYGSASEAGAWLTFYPPAGGIEFDIESGCIGFGAKTSIAGPGYHAALIDLCDRLQTQLGIVWRWDSGGDQTNYAVERGFEGLEEAFLNQVFAYCEFHRDYVKTGETHALNLPEGWVADGSEGVATPLGPVPGQLLLDALDDRTEEAALAHRIFPWWSPAADDEFWINSLRALLWTEVEWRSPRTPWESHVHSAALGVGNRLRNVLDTPLREAVDELAALSPNRESFVPPAAAGIGYLRRKRAFFVGGGWRVNLPGYYIEQVEDDGDTICFWFGNEEIRGSSYIISSKDGQPEADFTWHEELVDQIDRDGGGFIYRFDPVAKPSANCPGYSSARAEFQTRDAQGEGNLLILSIYGPDHDLAVRLREIAEGVWLQPPSEEVGNHVH